jgi:hypothetical protein
MLKCPWKAQPVHPLFFMEPGDFFRFKTAQRNSFVITCLNLYVCMYMYVAYIALYIHTYCDGFVQSIARQRLGKHPTIEVHATIEGRPFLGHA